MWVIVCNLQLFSHDQMIYVIDTESQQTIDYKVDIDEVIPTLCALAGKYPVKNIKLAGTGSVHAEAWANEVRSALALNYDYNNINVEVI